jgi:hypothetical protein
MDAARARSLLAWLAGFDGALADALTALEAEADDKAEKKGKSVGGEGEEEDAAVVRALLPMLDDGNLLRRVALMGGEPLLPLPSPQGQQVWEMREGG